MWVVDCKSTTQGWPDSRFFHIQGPYHHGHRRLATGISLLMSFHWPRPETDLRPQIAFGLVLVGAMGNLIGRPAFGNVIKFIEILPWFIFNVADILFKILSTAGATRTEFCTASDTPGKILPLSPFIHSYLEASAFGIPSNRSTVT